MRPIGRLLSVCALVLLTAAPALPAQRVHTVVNGQTLGAIARRYGISVGELREANQLSTGIHLKIGQRLLVPSPGEMARAKRAAAAKPGTSEPATPLPAADPAAELDDETPDTGSNTDVTAADQQENPEAPPATAPTSTHAQLPNETTIPAAPANDAEPSKRSDSKVERTNSPSESPRASRKKPKSTEHRNHVVAGGHTLGKIAKRYHVKIESLCGANGLRRNDPLKVGQQLVIPNGDEDPIIEEGPSTISPDGGGRSQREPVNPNALKELDVSGAGPVYYYEPTGTGRMSMRPIIVYLHGRGGDAQADCRRWSKVARRFGWLLCPSAPTPHHGGRTWSNNWYSGQQIVMGAVQALRKQYGRRVQLYGNTLVGFSEGAYVAMNVGVRQPRTFNRWLILGADVSYWGGSGLEALKDAKSKVRRVALITGGKDMVVDDTRTVAGWLEKEGVTLHIQTPGTLAHEVALDRMPAMYESALRWLDRGVEHPASSATRHR